MALLSMIIITVAVAALSLAAARLGLSAFLALVSPATQSPPRASMLP
jgi:hypothetical protein